MKTIRTLALCFLSSIITAQTVTVNVDVTQNRKNISPYIYGKNNSLSGNPLSPLSASEWIRLDDSGLKLLREGNGNNSTKYNWRLKLTSAPDWYNNVYGSDWDFKAQSMQENLPGVKGMFSFQLIGKAAASPDYNFDDWGYNRAAWWPGVAQNLAGEGVINTDYYATKALTDGDIDLYLMDWPADSTVGILDKWFGSQEGSLDLDTTIFEYWNMDNEPEIWDGTHDDVMPNQISAEEFMQRYFEVAKRARSKFPGIKLVGFVPCSEWFWYAYPDGTGDSGLITYKGSKYSWVEFFIKRISEEEEASGVKLLDVIDLHTYFTVSSEDELLQSHRIFYDETYVYPHANGVKLLGEGGWDSNINKEYIFKRVNDWLTEYMGAGHGVTIGSTEFGWSGFNQMPLALNYASTLGVFANGGVELFTPWFWSPSYWEVVHLFSSYSKNINVKSISSDEENVSAYSSANDANDSLTVVLVNRNASSTQTNIVFANFEVTDGIYPAFTLKDLPGDNKTETFVSHTDNALTVSNVVSADNVVSITLPAYSITSVVLSAGAAPGYYLGVSQTDIELSFEAGEEEIIVYANVDWTVSCDEAWITPGAVSGSNNGSFSIMVDENTTKEERVADITISGSGVTSQTVTITQASAPEYATEELAIYNDSETLIKGTWKNYGSLTEINTGAFEGTKHLSFEYNYTGWYANYGLNLTNWAGDGSGYNFAAYESLKFACRLTGASDVSIRLVDADASNTTESVDVEGITSSYADYTIPLTSFTGISLEDIGEIVVDLGGYASDAGVFEIDNIRLSVGQVDFQPSISANNVLVYPNPVSDVLIVESSQSIKLIEVYNITGSMIAEIKIDDMQHVALYEFTQFPAGIYHLRILSDNEMFVMKSVKKL